MESYKNMALKIIDEKYDKAKKRKMDLWAELAKETSEESLHICLFGRGLLGEIFYHILEDMGIKTKCFCDNDPNKWGMSQFENVICLSPEQLKEKYKQENMLVIASLGAVNEVYEQLKKMGVSNIIKHPFDLLYEWTNNWMNVSKKEILDGVGSLFDILADEQSKKIAYYKVSSLFKITEELNELSYGDVCTDEEYIPADIMKLKKNEMLVDCGSFTGDTLEYIMEDCGYRSFEKYTCFELSECNFKALKNRVESFDEEIKERIVLNNVGVSETNQTIKYTGEVSGTHISDDVGITGNVVSLDTAMKDELVTYLKMDIEGSEMSALRGAKELLKRNKPKCAICVYHKATDLWQIPLLLKEIVPEYRLYFRHHTETQNDTVCYAVI